jgi:hypothetical protein
MRHAGPDRRDAAEGDTSVIGNSLFVIRKQLFAAPRHPQRVKAVVKAGGQTGVHLRSDASARLGRHAARETHTPALLTINFLNKKGAQMHPPRIITGNQAVSSR